MVSVIAIPQDLVLISVLVMISVAVMKHHSQSQLGEGKVAFAYRLQSLLGEAKAGT